jgi:hypothetical protein
MSKGKRVMRAVWGLRGTSATLGHEPAWLLFAQLRDVFFAIRTASETAHE